MTRYFPELVDAFRSERPTGSSSTARSIVTGERLDFDALLNRIHPAKSRVDMLAEQTPASFVAFDILALDDESFLETPFAERRERLVGALRTAKPPIYVTPSTTSLDQAQGWFGEYEGAGLDGVVAKPGDVSTPRVRRCTR